MVWQALTYLSICLTASGQGRVFKLILHFGHVCMRRRLFLAELGVRRLTLKSPDVPEGDPSDTTGIVGIPFDMIGKPKPPLKYNRTVSTH